MVKVKKAISVAPPTAAPLKKTIKKKKEQNVEKKLSDAKTEPEQTHVPLVALVKPAKKLQVPAKKKAKQNKKDNGNDNKPTEGIKSENAKKLAAAETSVEKKTKTTKKSLQKQTNATNGGKIEKKPKLNKNKQLAKKLSTEAYTDAVKQTIEKVKVNKNKKPTNKKVAPIDLISTAELPKFDENDFEAIVTTTNIKKIAKSLKTIVEEEVSKKKNSLFTDYRYFLNIASFKIADCPKRMVKLNLKHSLVNKENDDVLIVVSDLQRGAKADYEPTIQHYTDLLLEHKVNDLGYKFTIMPFNQLRQEHKTFEAIRKLAATHEHYLCDSRVVGHAVGCVGKIFQKPRTTFHAVHLDKNDKLKERIKRGIHRTAYKQLHKGDLISIPVGNHNFTIQQLAENVQIVIQQLKHLYPGGYANIRSMHLKIDLAGTSSLPIYMSNGAAPLNTPYVVGPKEKRLLKLKRDANAVLQNFDLDKNGAIIPLGKKQAEKKQKGIEYHKNMLEVLKNKETTDNNGKKAKKAKKAKLEIKNQPEKAEDIKDDVDYDDEHDEQQDDEVDDD